MRRITLQEYLSIPQSYRGIWNTERWDIPNWEEIRKQHMGKRTMMVYNNGTCLLVEGIGFEIIDDVPAITRTRLRVNNNENND